MPAASVTERGKGSISLTAAAAVPLAVGVAAVSALQLLLWRARVVARQLEDEASKIWSDGSMMLDCSDEVFHRCIIQTAVNRGNAALGKGGTPSPSHPSAQEYYQSSSSSGVSSESDVEGTTNGSEVSRKIPRRMTKQVGGMASHKRPVQVLGEFILKPLRLLGGSRGAVGTDTTSTKEDATKAYRGVREIAFYEAVQFASMLPSDLGSSNDSFLQSCRFPCIGFHADTQHLAKSALNPLSSNSLPMQLGYFDGMALSAAYYADDLQVASSVQSYADAGRCIVREMEGLKRLARFTSLYFGVVDLDGLEGDEHSQTQRPPLLRPHLLLRNLTVPFRRPNIIDIKMGTQTYEPTAPVPKQIREAAKYREQSEFGFRIVGMRVHGPSAGEDDCRCWDKSYGVNLKTREEVMRAFATFFGFDKTAISTQYARRVLRSSIKQLAQLTKWFEEANGTLAFYAGSILIVYDGSESDESTSLAYQEPILKMIDFAHVCRQRGGDAGYLKGLRNLSMMLEEIDRKAESV